MGYVSCGCLFEVKRVKQSETDNRVLSRVYRVLGVINTAVNCMWLI